jgi:hypothetical protein
MTPPGTKTPGQVTAQKFDRERFNFKKLNSWRIVLGVKRFAPLENLRDSKGISSDRKNTGISVKRVLVITIRAG